MQFHQKYMQLEINLWSITNYLQANQTVQWLKIHSFPKITQLPSTIKRLELVLVTYLNSFIQDKLLQPQCNPTLMWHRNTPRLSLKCSIHTFLQQITKSRNCNRRASSLENLKRIKRCWYKTTGHLEQQSLVNKREVTWFCKIVKDKEGSCKELVASVCIEVAKIKIHKNPKYLKTVNFFIRSTNKLKLKK